MSTKYDYVEVLCVCDNLICWLPQSNISHNLCVVL
jgi:hypothetical protein